MTEAAENVERRWTPASTVALARLAVAAALLIVAFLGLPRAFAALLAAALVADAVDRAAGRRRARSSPRSARLGGWADLATYAGLPLAAHWLRPDLVHTEALAFWAILIGLAAPAVHGFIKYGVLAGPRTRLSAIAVYAVGGALIALFIEGPIWPLRLAAAALFAAALEEIAITALLPRPLAAGSLARALRLRRELGDDDGD